MSLKSQEFDKFSDTIFSLNRYLNTELQAWKKWIAPQNFNKPKILPRFLTHPVHPQKIHKSPFQSNYSDYDQIQNTTFWATILTAFVIMLFSLVASAVYLLRHKSLLNSSRRNLYIRLLVILALDLGLAVLVVLVPNIMYYIQSWFLNGNTSQVINVISTVVPDLYPVIINLIFLFGVESYCDFLMSFMPCKCCQGKTATQIYTRGKWFE